MIGALTWRLAGFGLIAAALIAVLAAAPAQGGETILHSFNGAAIHGAHPLGDLTLSGTTVYGMTSQGGDANLGVIFKVELDGSGYVVLHSFGGPALDGATPYGSLTLSGTTLYGMTSAGGGSGMGAVFSIQTDGTGLTILHSFAGGATDGSNPCGSLALGGTTGSGTPPLSLYGMTPGGGPADSGTVFKVNTDGTGFVLLHSFAGGTSDGAYPQASLTLSGSMLYGMTVSGGNGSNGAVFSMHTDGAGFGLLHSFAGGPADGSEPYGSLMLNDTTLYGMTNGGGSGGNGTVFSMSVNGTAFALLHSFAGGAADGSQPSGGLAMTGTTLFGMTYIGGSSNAGTVFALSSHGAFAVLHSFTDQSDGGYLNGTPTLSNGMLYGMAPWGGSDGGGNVFSINLTGASFALVHTFDAVAADGAGPEGNLTLSDARLYGMTPQGDSGSFGNVFAVNTDGGGYSVLHSFAGGATDGAGPNGALTLSGTTLYGMTRTGGSGGYGTVFSIHTDGTGLTLLHAFAGGTSDGAYPNGSLTLSGTTLYGMTTEGGSKGFGVVFSIDVGGGSFALLHTFAGGAADGEYPCGSLTLIGSTLYGMTNGGGAASGDGYGTIFSMAADGTGFTLLHAFAGGVTDGAYPYDSLTLSGSTGSGTPPLSLYGMTSCGGSNVGNGYGTAFSISTGGTGFKLLHSFAGGATEGTSPLGNLTLNGSTLYGMTYGGGSGNGTIFSMATDGTGFALVHAFAGDATDGGVPFGSLTLSGTSLYGTTAVGGPFSTGTVFKFDLQAATGDVQVTLAPPQAAAAGAAWSVDGGATWRASGETVSGSLAVGPHALTFKPLSGWTTPQSQTVTIAAGATTTATGTYAPLAGALSLAAGYNLISLAFSDSGWTTAENLCAHIAGSQAIWKWDGASQQWSGHIPGTPTNNFALTPGAAYLLSVASATTAVIPGTAWAASSNSLSVGYNLIALPKSRESLADAQALAGSVASCTAIWKWDNATQAWSGHIPGTPTNNFSISVGEAYLIYVTAASNWP